MSRPFLLSDEVLEDHDALDSEDKPSEQVADDVLRGEPASGWHDRVS
ncbi:MAG TPA: hypothetical protein VNM92_00560 [Thermoanaerobaculia bacterium]|nr:hypothetical protein [Thermoanaerobaculia bacterium]